MERKTVVFIGGVVLLGVAVMIAVVLWLRAQNEYQDTAQLQRGVSPVSSQGARSVQSAIPMRPFTPIDKQPKAEPYVPGTTATPAPPLDDRIRL